MSQQQWGGGGIGRGRRPVACVCAGSSGHLGMKAKCCSLVRRTPWLGKVADGYGACRCRGPAWGFGLGGWCLLKVDLGVGLVSYCTWFAEC